MVENHELSEMPAELQAVVENACENFETAWQAGQQPTMTETLAGFHDRDRKVLLRELIAIERHYRSAIGNSPVSNEDFLSRYPTLRDELFDVFAETPDDSQTAQGDTQLNADPLARTTTDAPPFAPFEKLPVEFGRYRLLDRLGTGGMGTVYLAEDTQLERQVALKLPQFGSDSDSQMVQRFYREAKAAATISHPGLCSVYDVGDIAGTHFLTMEYIKGRSFAECLKAGDRFSDEDIVRIIRDIAAALEEAHQKGVVHRDLKPANIMIDEEGNPTVTDFGLARRSDDEATQLTHHGQIVGTPAYMSPEQVDGNLEKIGPASDVYSLGVVLFELLTGQRPFQGSTAAIFGQIMTADVPSMSDIRGDLDPQLEVICRKMMSRQIEDRFPSMQEVVQAMEAWLATANQPQSDFPRRIRTQMPVALLAVGLLIVAGYVIRIKTSTGEVVVESSVPGVTVDIFRDGEPAVEGWELNLGRNATSLRTGEIEVRLPTNVAGSFEVSQDAVTLSDDGRIIAKVTRRTNDTPSGETRDALDTESGSNPETPAVVVEHVAQTPLPDGPPGLVATFEGHQNLVKAVAFSSDGIHVASASADASIRIWNAELKILRRRLQIHSVSTCVAFSSDAKLVAGNEGSTVKVWSMDTGQLQHELKGHSNHHIGTLAFNPVTEELASGGYDQNVFVWDLATGKVRYQLPKRPNAVAQLIWSPDGNILFCCCREANNSGGRISAWDVRQEKELWTATPEPIHGLQVNRDFTRIAFSGWNALHVTKLSSLQTPPDVSLRTRVGGFRIHPEGNSMAFHPNGRHIICGCDDRVIRIVDSDYGFKVFEFKAEKQVTSHVAVSPDGRFVVSGGDRYHRPDFSGYEDDGDYSVRLWRLPALE